MKNNKDNAEEKNKAYDFSIADADYFYSEENESGIIKVYFFKKILMFSVLLSAALLIFIILYLHYRF